ncbi:hypothetical protein PF007_g31847 [Phytophthora fragariae]|uniref:Uncharacterized protein n=3 Tax=Phytophthora TaxID=4783 RepID=A0A6A3PF33_9STRA|nr:hypothetical protein PF007_g31847 [Phytophthora fragariae]
MFSVDEPAFLSWMLVLEQQTCERPMLKETYVECSDKITHADPRPLHWSPYGASDSPAKTPANATLKLDVELLAFGPKAKEM